jgi:hypothetical protein
MSKLSEIEARVFNFQALALPGQPRMMHMGSAQLVSDLLLMLKTAHRQLQINRQGYLNLAELYSIDTAEAVADIDQVLA